MRYRRCIAPVVVSLLLTCAQAQLRGGNGQNTTGNVHVHIILSNDRNAGPYLKVCLMEGSVDQVIGTSYTNDIGEVDFLSVPMGQYHVEVSVMTEWRRLSALPSMSTTASITQSQYVHGATGGRDRA